MSTVFSEYPSGPSLRLYIPAVMSIVQMNSREVRSSVAVITLRRISNEEIEFESDLHFPIHADVVCRMTLPLPTGNFELTAQMTECIMEQGKYRYVVKPRLRPNVQLEWMKAVRSSSRRYEQFYQTVHEAYGGIDHAGRPALSFQTTI